MPADSQGRVAVVTGAAASIGQALAVRLAADGHRVAIADLDPATETERMIDQSGGEAEGFICRGGQGALWRLRRPDRQRRHLSDRPVS
jgi:NAD(P)-dependent dehydrogenase (short-subunit alcohol dehydrogenase family)